MLVEKLVKIKKIQSLRNKKEMIITYTVQQKNCI